MTNQIPPLKPEHEKMLSWEGDVHLLEIVYGLTEDILNTIDETYEPKNLREYNALQAEWLTEEKWLVGTKAGHEPSATEQIEDMERERLTRRFRVYFVLSRPERVRRKL
jgi:hypothetical protein